MLWPVAVAAVPPEVSRACQPGETPREVAEIVFAGNDVTRRDTMLRELGFAEGDTVCVEEIAFGTQALLDLRLFRAADVAVQENASGTVTLTYSVVERWYILPLPRVDANSDSTFGLGVNLSWNNVGGRNHRLSMTAVRRELDERDRDDETIVSGRYDWRRFMGSRWNLSLSGGYARESATIDEQIFEERVSSAGVGLARQLTSDRTGQGWSLSSGLQWRNSSNIGVDAPPDEGQLTSASVGLGYTNLHSQVYSDRGVSGGVSLVADVAPLSDYDQTTLSASYRHIWPIGRRAHQTLQLRLSAATLHGGPNVRKSDSFSLGGAGSLRGFDNEYAEGDGFWLASVAYLRPVRWDWLRALALLEIGDVARSGFGRDPGVLASLGLGFRVRITWFVDAEVEFGIGIPLIREDGFRFFAGGAG